MSEKLEVTQMCVDGEVGKHTPTSVDPERTLSRHTVWFQFYKVQSQAEGSSVLFALPVS